MEAFLYMFEQMAHCEGCPEEEWAHSLAPLLTVESQWYNYALPPASADDYTILKGEILAR